MKGDPPQLPQLSEFQDLAALQAQMQKPALRANLDGGFELGWGTMILCGGLVPYINALLPKSFWLSPWTMWMSYLPLLGMAFAPFAIPKLVKRFITWPRTGYFAHPNEVTFKQLLMLMGFGLALGFGVTLPFRLAADYRNLPSGPGGVSGSHDFVWHSIELLVCVTLTVFLGRKVIRKRPPVPSAYDPTLMKQAFGQTAEGRRRMRLVKSAIFAMFFGIPLLLFGLVFAGMYLSKAAVRETEIHWPHLGALSFLLMANAVLYLMGNGLALKQHKWKWLMLVLLLIGPVLVAPIIPHPDIKPELAPVLELFPPTATLFMGLIWFVSGAVTLILFMRHYPLQCAPAP